MILGIGHDLTDIRRIEKMLERHGGRFLARVLTESERADAARRIPSAQAAFVAKRFAAKEACVKALGTGLYRQGIGFQEIGVVSEPSGRPTLVLTGGAATYLAHMTPPGLQAQLFLSLTDESPWAQAFVVIAAENVL